MINKEKAYILLTEIINKYHKENRSKQWAYKQIENITFFDDKSSFYSEEEIWEIINEL